MVLLLPGRLATWLLTACVLLSCVSSAKPKCEYADRANALLKEAIFVGEVRYSEVVRASYGPLGIDRTILETKRKWRELTATLGFSYLSDYDLWEEAASVRSIEGERRRLGASVLVADYEAVHHQIRLSQRATGFTLYHEAGHALQREAIRRQASSAYPNGDYSSKASKVDLSDLSFRLLEQFRYLSMQDELEIRLQDLNRAHAFRFGSAPIITEVDTLRALAALGFRLEVSEVAAAYRWAGVELDEAVFQASVKGVEELSPNDLNQFRDARELAVLRRLALKVDPDAWPRLFAKILFEAPGHL